MRTVRGSGEPVNANLKEDDLQRIQDFFADAFEREFARFYGRPYAMLVNSGSSANLLALSALTSPCPRRSPPAPRR